MYIFIHRCIEILNCTSIHSIYMLTSRYTLFPYRGIHTLHVVSQCKILLRRAAQYLELIFNEFGRNVVFYTFPLFITYKYISCISIKDIS